MQKILPSNFYLSALTLIRHSMPCRNDMIRTEKFFILPRQLLDYHAWSPFLPAWKADATSVHHIFDRIVEARGRRIWEELRETFRGCRRRCRRRWCTANRHTAHHYAIGGVELLLFKGNFSLSRARLVRLHFGGCFHCTVLPLVSWSHCHIYIFVYLTKFTYIHLSG